MKGKYGRKDKMFYSLFCWGNFSHDFSWDSGMNVSLEGIFQSLDNVEGWRSPYFPAVIESDFNEHGGSRNCQLYVIAHNEAEALERARKFLDYYYPEK